MASPLKAALIGAGSMGRNHARILASLPDVAFVGVLDPAPGPWLLGAGVPVFRDLEELVAAAPDYCVVASPTSTHRSIALRLAAARIPALIEKPLAATAEDAQVIAGAYADARVVAAVGHIERYNPALQEVKRRLEAGELGKVFQIATRRQGPFPARIADVGVVLDLATHDIDSTRWVAGASFESVAAQTVHQSGRVFEDLVTISGRLTGDIVTSHLVNWLSPLKERVTVITGEAGAFVADTLTADLTFFANGTVDLEWGELARFRGVSEGDVTRFAIRKQEPLLAEHEAFRDAVRGEDASIVSVQAGVETVSVAEAVLASARASGALQALHLKGSDPR